jgi:Na+/proline symporter
MTASHQLDWKVVFFAVIACYLVPWLLLGVVGSLILGLTAEGVSVRAEGVYWWWVAVNTLASFVGLPLFAGYFTARFARNRPQLHVLIVALVGIALFAVITQRDTAVLLVVFVAAWLSMAALGAFLVMRSNAKGGP